MCFWKTFIKRLQLVCSADVVLLNFYLIFAKLFLDTVFLIRCLCSAYFVGVLHFTRVHGSSQIAKLCSFIYKILLQKYNIKLHKLGNILFFWYLLSYKIQQKRIINKYNFNSWLSCRFIYSVYKSTHLID
jgi:hypothetical protein